MRRRFIHLTLLISMVGAFAFTAKAEESRVSAADGIDSAPVVKISLSDKVSRDELMGVDTASQQKPVASAFQKTATSMANGSVTGGGSPMNLTNHFQLDSFSGSGIFQYPVALPPGRVGVQPTVILTYSPRTGNGLLGMGWSLDFGSIERSLKNGVPAYDNSDTFISTLGGGSHELVSTGNGNYRARNEGSFMTYSYDGQRWTAQDTGGRTYYFGLDQVFNDASRVKDPQDASRVYRWRLSEVKDIHGNYYLITYSADGAMTIYYTGEPGTDRQGLGTAAQKLAVKVSIETESADRPDPFTGYRSGFAIPVTRRIQNIRVEAAGKLYQSYALNYSVSARTGQSLLNAISAYGSDGKRSLPDVTFSYTGQEAVPYQLSSILNDPTVGDNLWNIRQGGTINVHENLYSVLPRYTGDQGAFVRGDNPNKLEGYINWGTPYVVSSYNRGGTAWNHLGGGMLNYNGAKDTSFHAWVYVYSLADQTVYLNINGSVVDAYVNQEPGTYTPGSVHARNYSFKQGYNLIEVGGYHNHSTNTFNVSTNLTNHFSVVNSSQVVVPQLAGDFNGDGLVDVATYYSQVGNVKVALSNGSGFAPKVQWFAGMGNNQQIVLGDFNRDGRTDLCVMNPLNGQWRVLTSDGSKLVDQGVWISNFGVNAQPGVIDFDGDGRTDVVSYYKESGQLKFRVALNTGNTFALDQAGIVVASTDLAQPFTVDFNGDGLPDFGSFRKDTGTWEIRISDGRGAYLRWPDVTGFGLNRNPVVADYNLDGKADLGYYDYPTGKIFYRRTQEGGFAIQQEISTAFNLREGAAQVQTADFNGDGIVDYAVYNEIGNLEVALSGHSPADLLRRIDNGVGGIRQLRYAPSTRFDNTYLPFVIPVIDMMTLGTTLGDEYSSQYQYAWGLWDIERREFRGFGMVRQIDTDGHYGESEYLQEEFTQGRLSRQRFFGQGQTQPFTEQKMLWETQDVGNGARFVYLKEKVNYSYDGNPVGKATAESFTYGETPQYGNLTKMIQHGEVETSSVPGKIVDKTGIQDSRRFETTYAAVNQSTGVSGLPAQTRVYNHTGELVRKTEFAYDNLSYGAVPVKGLLTLKKDWGGDQVGAQHPETRYAYDAYGNLVKTTDPSGQSTSIVFDATYHLFPMTITNAKNHSVTNRYFGINSLTPPTGCQGLWGQLFETTDPNQNAGQRCYDAAGRTVKTVSPLDTHAYPSTETQFLFTDNYVRVKSSQRIRHGQPGMIDVYQFSDGLGRLIQTKSPTRDPLRWTVSGITTYNARGLEHSQFNPFFSTEPVDYLYTHANLPAGTPETIMSYDAMGRGIRTDYSDNTHSNTIYDGWMVVNFNENGHKQTSKFDAYGRLIEKIEHLGADGRAAQYPAVNYTDYAITRYQYDSEGQLIKTIDAKNNQTVIEYDKLGRKVRMVDPDMGTWTYRYDLNGNLVEQTDNKGQKIYFTYDQLNRLVRKFDNLKLEVNYNYDSDASATSLHEKGRLTEVNYGTGLPESTAFEYDALGRELRSTKSISGASYRVERQYDAINNLLNITYPDQEKVFYKYNNAGQIEKISNDASILDGARLNSSFSNPEFKEAIIIGAVQRNRGVSAFFDHPSLRPQLAVRDSLSGGFTQAHPTDHREGLKTAQEFMVRLGAGMVRVWNDYLLGAREASAATDYTKDPSCQAAYLLDGNAQDSCRDRHGSVIGAVAVDEGQRGGAYQFNGGADRIDLGTFDPSTGDLTLVMWVDWKGSNGLRQGLITKRQIYNSASYNRWEFQREAGGNLSFGQYASRQYLKSFSTTGKWVHLALVHRAGVDTRLYFDGVLVDTKGAVQYGNKADAEIAIGSINIGGTRYGFNGKIDEVGVFSRALSVTEIGDIMASGLRGAGQTPPVADTESPTVPTGLTGQALSASAVRLDWTASVDNVGVTGYEIYRDGVKISTVTGLTYSDAGLTAQTNYSYTFRAIDAAGNMSALSAPVSVRTLALPGVSGPVTVTLNPVADAEIRGFEANTNLNVRGLGAREIGSAYSRTSLLKFDLSAIPAGSSIKSVKLSFTLSSKQTWNKRNYVYECLRDWVENEVTFRQWKAGSLWSTAGARGNGTDMIGHYSGNSGGYVASVTQWTAVAGDKVTYTSESGFVDLATRKIGGILNLVLHQKLNNNSDVSYYDREHADVSRRPQLVVEYVPDGSDRVAPSVPMGLQARAVSGSRVDVSWLASSDNVGISGYKIFRDQTLVGSVATTTWTDSAVSPSRTYTYSVRAYDAAGNESVASSGVAVSTPSAAMIYVEHVEYNAAGQIQKIILGNGITTEYEYDSRLRLRRTRGYDQSGKTVQDLRYTYDAGGNILQILDGVNTASQTFVYDALGRLVRAENPSTYKVKAYVYDQIGNILQKDGRVYTYAEGGAGPHAVTRTVGGGVTTTYTYDANGNMATKQVGGEITFFTYDAENRLIQVSKGASLSTAQKMEEYKYDGDGGRTWKMGYNNGVAESSTEFIGSLFEKTGNRRTTHVFLDNIRVASVTDGEVFWPLHDHLGGTNLLTDATAKVKQIIEYEPYGKEARNELLNLEPHLAARHTFTSHFKDEKTGLIYMQARYYDAELGRFITSDTIVQSPQNPQTYNRYTYCSGNPVNRVDPSGHGWFSKTVNKINNWIMRGIESLENKWNVGISVDVEFGYSSNHENPVVDPVSNTLRTGISLANEMIRNPLSPFGIFVGIGNWLYEDRFRFVDVNTRRSIAFINDNDTLFINGIITPINAAINQAGRARANVLAYNPTSGVWADLVESTLDKVLFTSSVTRQISRGLAGRNGIQLIGFSQGGMIASNVALSLGLNNQRNVVSTLRVYSTQISQIRIAVSGAVAGGLTWQKTVIFGVGSPFDFSNALGPNIGPSFISGLAGLSILPIGISNHSMP